MPHKFTAIFNRLHIGRILLLLLFVLVLLAAGFVLRGFAPSGWLQSLRVGSFGLPAWITQRPEASPTAPVEVVAGLKSTHTPALTALPTSSPTTASTAKPVEVGAEVVTVLTLTPTLEIRATETMAAVTVTSSPTATSSFASTAASDPLTSIPDQLRSLNRLISVSRILMLTFGEGQPVEEERALLDAQLQVVILRMETLEARLLTDEAAGETFGTGGTITSGQAAEFIAMMREVVYLLRGELASPEVDGAALIPMEAQLGLIQEIVQQLRVMAGSVQDDAVSVEPTPAPTSTPTPLPTPIIQASAPIDELLALMEEMLRLMQEIMPPASTNP